MSDTTENLDSIDTAEQADELLSSIEQPQDRIMDKAPEQKPTVDEWEFTVGGKQVKAPRDQVIQWAQQGYTAPGQIAKYTRELETLKKQYSEAESKYKDWDTKYGPVDQYVRQNPQFWDHVMQSYEQRNSLLSDQSNPMAQMVRDLQTQVQDLVQYKSQLEEQQTKQRMSQEDQAYLGQLTEMKKAYADIDFDTPDAEGKSLEYKVLEYAQQEGIKNFKTAFKDFYHDELLKRAESKAKESLIKDKQKNTKLGVLGVSPTPTKTPSSRNIRQSSYDDLTREALAELGIG